jgi:sugar lactone lactonase YvrE
MKTLLRFATIFVPFYLGLGYHAARAGQTLYAVTTGGDTYSFKINEVSAGGQVTNLAAGTIPPTGSVSTIAVAPSGNVYVTETFALADGGVLTYSPTGQYLGLLTSAPASNSDFAYSQDGGVAVDAYGNIWTSYLAEARQGVPGGLFDVFEKFSPTGNLIQSFEYHYDGVNLLSNYFPNSMVIGSNGNLYVGTDGQVLEFSPSGNRLVSFGAGSNNPAVSNVFTSIAVAPSGDVYAVDGLTHVVEQFSPTGQSLGDFAPLSGFATSVAINSSGIIYISNGDYIYGFTPSGQPTGFEAFSPSGTTGMTFGPGSVPEPTSITLFAVGLAFMALHLRNRK